MTAITDLLREWWACVNEFFDEAMDVFGSDDD